VALSAHDRRRSKSLALGFQASLNDLHLVLACA